MCSRLLSFLTAAAIWSMCAVPLMAEPLKIGAWNIANLHHEDGVALRPGAVARDPEDYDRLKVFAQSLALDVVVLQEIGSPSAARRIFPESEYEIVMSDLYKPGAETAPAEDRDIYTAIALRKARFPSLPDIEFVDALALQHVTVREGKPEARFVRGGIALKLTVGGKSIKLLDVHLKSACSNFSLDPVLDEKNGSPLASRYDCRTLQAQALILENWIEQQAQVGNSVIVLGDFNRQLNRFDGDTSHVEHFWASLNDGAPNDLQLRKGPLGKNTECWAGHDPFFSEHIEFFVFDASLDSLLKSENIKKVPYPDQDNARYTGKNYEKLSDHCPVVATLDAE
jgi:hypothetical protein